MAIIPNTTAIILAGGKSTRMGKDKGLMLLDNKPMIQYIIETVSKLTPNVLIIANNQAYQKFGLPVYRDAVKEKGPLAGIVTGLEVSETDVNWIIACDTPHVTSDLLRDLKNGLIGHDAVIASSQDRIHPLIAVYNKSALPILKLELEKNNLKLMRANSAINTRIFNADEHDLINFKNINSKEDL